MKEPTIIKTEQEARDVLTVGMILYINLGGDLDLKIKSVNGRNVSAVPVEYDDERTFNDDFLEVGAPDIYNYSDFIGAEIIRPAAPIKKFNLNPRFLNTWIRQNNGVIIDGLNGSLLDNMLIECKRGAAVIKETFINGNMSTYTIYFCRDFSIISAFWEDLKQKYIKQFGPIE